MAKATKTKPAAVADGEDEAPKSKKKLFMIIGAVVLAAGGYFGYSQLTAAPADAAAAEPVKGEVVTMDPVPVNLAGGGYLKVGIALQLTADAEEADGAEALDLMIAEYSQADITKVNTERDAMKAELLEKIKTAYHDEVMDIYFTSYVTQ